MSSTQTPVQIRTGYTHSWVGSWPTGQIVPRSDRGKGDHTSCLAIRHLSKSGPGTPTPEIDLKRVPKRNLLPTRFLRTFMERQIKQWSGAAQEVVQRSTLKSERKVSGYTHSDRVGIPTQISGLMLGCWGWAPDAQRTHTSKVRKVATIAGACIAWTSEKNTKLLLYAPLWIRVSHINLIVHCSLATSYRKSIRQKSQLVKFV